jgi:hypothetical protein
VEEVVGQLFTKLQADKPSSHEGLKALLERSSPFNFLKSKPFEEVVQIMAGGKYQILLGQFESFRVLPILTTLPGQDETAILDVEVQAKSPVLDRCGTPLTARVATTLANVEKVTFRVELHNPTGGRWLFDTLYYVFSDAVA